MGQVLRLDELPLNEPLKDNLYDYDGKPLMLRGAKLTAENIKAFALKGLRYLELGDPGDRPNSAITTLEPIHEDLRTEDWSVPQESTAPAPSTATIRVPQIPLDPKVAMRVSHLVHRAARTVEELGKSLADGSLRDAAPIRAVADDFLTELQADADQTLTVSLKQHADLQLAERCVQLSVLSMAISRAMKMTSEEQATVGTAALLHDMALFELGPEERHSPELMHPDARRIYESHPAIAYDMLEKVRDIDGTVRIIVLQTHEQADGSGFPRGISMPRIHRLARVVNLADAYLTLVGCGPGCQKIFPADALAYLMHHSCAGRFEPQVTCGLVRAVSLYPLGSLVRLSDDRVGRVVRVKPDKPSTPVVAIHDSSGDTLIDTGAEKLVVAEPLDDHSLARHRISSTDMDKILW